MAQPETMAQMVNSILDVYNSTTGGHGVVPTIATKAMTELSTAQRLVAVAMFQQAILADTGLNATNLVPGPHTLRQTDEFYRTHDPDGNYVRLAHIVVSVAQRTR